jgi:hypothetical protein
MTPESGFNLVLGVMAFCILVSAAVLIWALVLDRIATIEESHDDLAPSFDPAKTAGGCAGKSWGAYASPVNPDRELEVPSDMATELP